jgi:uncharacterized membrane protein
MTDMIAVAYPNQDIAQRALVELHALKQLGERLAPGHAAVIALISDATADKALPRMARFGGDVLHTSLSHDDELQLSHALQLQRQTAG